MPVVRRVLLLAGLPFSAELFAPVVARLGVVLPEVRVQAYGPWQPDEVRADFAGAVVVAHGLAVPPALEIARAVTPLAFIASNGPVSRLDPATQSIVRLTSVPGVSALAASLGFLPAPWLMALRSSAALRRMVNNPYAMDRDTVAAICGPLVATGADRAKLRAGFAALGRVLLPQPLPPCRVVALWGDNDRLYPTYELDLLAAMRPDVEVRVVPGGRFLHVVEQPWSFADAVADIVRQVQSPPAADDGISSSAADLTPKPATEAPMSRKGRSAKSGTKRGSTTVSVVRS